MKTYQGHKNEKYSISGAFGVFDDGNKAFAVSGSEDTSLIIWDVSNKNILQRLEGHTGAVLGVDTNPDSSLLVSGGLDCTISVWMRYDIDEDELEAKDESIE